MHITLTDGTEPSHWPNGDEVLYNEGYEWWLMKEAKKVEPQPFHSVCYHL